MFRLGVLPPPPARLPALISVISSSLGASGSPRLLGAQCPEQRGAQGLPEASAFLAGPGEMDVRVQEPHAEGWGS